MPPVPHVHVAVIGTGFGGLGMALRLLDDGENDFAVFERANTVGGVWRDNVYPGAACDVESHLYTLRDAPNPTWTRRFSTQPEIQDYLADLADARGVTPHIRFGHDVTEAAWDEAAARWRIATSRGDWTTDVLVSAVGALAEPRLPKIPGLEGFDGPVVHTAHWDPDLDFDGARIAVIGTGASAIQLVPALQPHASHLTLFQRTPAWVIPRRDRALGPRLRRRLERWPLLQRVVRGALYASHEARGLPFRIPQLAGVGEWLALRHLRAQVPDPDLRRLLRPDYRFGCKRILLSDDFYPALTQPNVTVTGAAAEVRAQSVVDAGGRAHPADMIALATGFHVHDFPFTECVLGRGGQRLADVWDGAPAAHVGTTVAGFPNLFLISGPNTGLGHSSVLLTMEAQIEHVAGALRTMEARGLAAVEPRLEAQAAFVSEVDRRTAGTAWTAGCQSWYLDANGRNAAIWPGSVGSFRRRVATFRPDEYRLRPADA